MPDYIGHGQSALDFRECRRSPVDINNTPSTRDVFPGEALIGIALGSPRDCPLPFLAPGDSGRYVPQKPKVSKWRAFGGLFGRKGLTRSASTLPDPQCSPFRELTPSLTREERNMEVSGITNCYASRTESSQDSWRPALSPSPKRTPTVGTKNLRRKISFKRSKSQGKGVQSGSQANRKRSHTAPVPRPEEDGPNFRLNGESLLRVEIPNVEMERYSVMFSNLLEPPTTSSLLARRQAHLDELYTGSPAKKVVDTSHQDHERPKFERRTPSTSSTKSSTFSLFPTTQNAPNRSSARKVTLERSPLSRSATALGATSPGRAKTELSEPQEQNHVIVILHSPARTPSTAASKSSHRGNASSDTSHHSQSSTDANFVEAPESPILTSPMKKEDLPLRKSSMRALQKPPNTFANAIPEPDAPDQKFRAAAEISIARQISVSRRQRHLLVPIVPKTARQPMQPTVVDMRDPSPCRKSHHLVLESS